MWSADRGAKIIMAFKANALWRTFPVIAEYNRDFTASSLNELRLGAETLGGEAHSYCPHIPTTLSTNIWLCRLISPSTPSVRPPDLHLGLPRPG